MLESHVDIADESRAEWGFLLTTTLVLSAGFFAAMHRWDISQVADFNLQAEFEDIVAGGDMGRRVGFFLFAVFGAGCLLRPARVSFRFQNALSLLLLLTCVWCFASVLWSIDQQITIRRLSVLAFCLIAAVGIARQLSLQQLTLVALAVGSISAFAGVGVEILLNTFRPWASEYRFAGAMHPNVQGLQCAVMSIAAIALAATSRRRTLFILISVAAVGLLLLTKSRTALSAFLLAASAMWLVQLQATRAVFVFVLGTFLVCLAFFAVQAIGPASADFAPSFLLMGRTDDVTTLSGRTDAWTAVVPYIHRDPLLGAGYGAFWNLDNIAAISDELQWYATNSHSAYLDIALELGLPGSVALACFFLLGLATTGTMARRAPDAGNLFLFGLLVLTALDACLESLVIQPLLAGLVVFSGVAHVAYFRRATSGQVPYLEQARYLAATSQGTMTPSRLAWKLPKGT